jgi:hypothetical protein
MLKRTVKDGLQQRDMTYTTFHYGANDTITHANTYFSSSNKLGGTIEYNQLGDMYKITNYDTSGNMINYTICHYKDIGIENVQERKEAGFDIYPNPFRPSTVLIFPSHYKSATASIYSPSGRRVGHFTNLTSNTLQWNADRLANGVYIVKANIDGRIYSKKVHLQR